MQKNLATLSRQLIVFSAVILIAFICFLLWINEPQTTSESVEWLFKGFNAKYPFFPMTAIPIAFLTSLSFTLTLSIFVKNNSFKKYLFFVLIVFVLTITTFYINCYSLYDMCSSWFKVPGLHFLFGIFILIPIYSIAIRMITNRYLIKTSKRFQLYFWTAIISSIPLGVICSYIFDSYFKQHDYSFFETLFNGYEEGYIALLLNLTISFSTYLFYMNQDTIEQVH